MNCTYPAAACTADALRWMVQRTWVALRAIGSRLLGSDEAAWLQEALSPRNSLCSGEDGAAVDLAQYDGCDATGLWAAGKAPEAATAHERLASCEMVLLDECWLGILEWMSPGELCIVAGLNAKFRALANDDDLWRQHCRRRWAGKQRMEGELFRLGDYRRVRLSVAECKSLLLRRGVGCAHIKEKDELLAAVASSTPPHRGLRRPLPIPGKWKTSFAYAELDSHRQLITPEEVAHFRWQLFYHGQPSSLGLRHFQADGTFISPHFGQTSWYLDGWGNFVMHGIAPLCVQRNPENWGWVIGAGTGTVYHSVEV